MNILVKDDFEIDRYPHFTMNLKGHTIVGYREDKDNLCTDLENDCNGELKTSLWNEFIATPIKILGVDEK